LNNTDILSNTAGGSGGGLYAEAPITLTAGRFVNNTANDGGGLYAQSDVNLSGGSYRSNSATVDGGGLNVGGNLSMVLIDLISNTAGNDGGAVHAQNAATFNFINVVNNSATSGGGGLYVYGPLTATNSRFENNSGDNGGGAYVGGVANLVNTVLVSNTAVTGHGGGLKGWAEVDAVNSTFIANHCDGATCKGGGLFAEDILVLTNTDFLSNTSAANFAGAWVNADAQVMGGQFRNNNSPAGDGGGALGVSGNLTMTNSSFINNTGGSNYGGAVWVVNGSAWLNGGLFRDNVGGNGGAINVDNGTLSASGTVFVANEATAFGGAIHANDVNLDAAYLQNNTGGGAGAVWGQSTVVATATQFISNSATYTDTSSNGGAVYAATAILTNSTLAGNQSQYQSGGGVYATDLTLENVTFNANSAFSNGGGAFAQNSAMAKRSTFKNNSASSDGGAIYSASDATVLDSALSANTAGGNGGGLFANDNLTVQRVRFADNSAVGNGGGVYANTYTAADQLAVERSKFIGNAADVGGGLYHTGLGSGSIVNSLFTRNTAATEADGLSLNSDGSVAVTFSTLANPGSATGQALVVNAGTVNVTNTIVTSYSIGLKQTGGSLTEDYNLYFGNTLNQIGFVGLGGHPLYVDPRFVKPSVDDYHLSLFSPAVDNALDLGVAIDLGGWPRPTGPGFDRGAFELQAQSTSVNQNTGGQLNYVDNQGLTTTVLLPPGLVTTGTTIIFNNLNGESITSTPPSGLMFAGKLFELDAFLGSLQLHNITFTQPVTLVLQYSEADLGGIDEHSLRLYRFETSVNDWRPIGFRSGESQVLDIDNNTLTVVLRGFSRFGKMGASGFYEIFIPIVVKNH
jgi:predicted outer membrane repeat protein